MKKRAKKTLMILKCTLGFSLHDITMSKEESVTIKIKKTFSNEKKYCHNTLFQTIKLICIFLSVIQQQKLMKKDILAQIEKKETEREEKT